MEKRSDSVYFPHFFLCAVQWSRANDGARSLTEILFRFFFEIEVSPMINNKTNNNLRLTTTL